MKKGKKPHKGLETREVSVHGKGLFVCSPIKKGAFVVEYTGNIIPNTIADEMESMYLFDLENGTSIDGSPEWNLARYINHGCFPNVEAELDEELGRVFIYATRDIAAGEELFIDYGSEFVSDYILPYGCACPSPVHTGGGPVGKVAS